LATCWSQEKASGSDFTSQRAIGAVVLAAGMMRLAPPLAPEGLLPIW
jgi:hypothetical protein